MKKILLSAIALATLAACANTLPKRGIGFTGIDGEPRSLSESRGSADYVGRFMTVPVAFAELAPRRVISDAPDQAKLARVAVDNGGRVPGAAIEVGGDERTLMLSSVEVNGALYAVLRTPENSPFAIAPNVASGFGRSIPRLTGCLPAGNVYQNGSGKRATGLAVPLNCR